MIARIALYATLGTLCSALGYTWDSTEFWCILGLFWAADVLGRNEGHQQAASEYEELLDQAVDNIQAANNQLIQARDTIVELTKKNNND